MNQATACTFTLRIVSYLNLVIFHSIFWGRYHDVVSVFFSFSKKLISFDLFISINCIVLRLHIMWFSKFDKVIWSFLILSLDYRLRSEILLGMDWFSVVFGFYARDMVCRSSHNILYAAIHMVYGIDWIFSCVHRSYVRYDNIVNWFTAKHSLIHSKAFRKRFPCN